MGKVPTTCRHQALEEQLAPRRSRQRHAPMDRRDAYRFHKGVSRHRRFSNAACCDTAAHTSSADACIGLMAGACMQSARVLLIISMPIGVAANAHRHQGAWFCAFWPRLGDIMGGRHRRYGRGILAVCPDLIGLGSHCEPRMPVGVAANAHRHEGAYFLRIIQGSAAPWALGIDRMAEPYWQSARASSRIGTCISCDSLDALQRPEACWHSA